MAWAAVAGHTAHNVATNTTTVSLGAISGTSGNRIAVHVAANHSGSAQTTSVTDGVNTYTEDSFTTYNDSGFQSRNSVFSCVASTTASVTVVAHFLNSGGTGACNSTAQEYSGLATVGGSSDIDTQTSIAGVAGGTATVTTGGNTSAANELVLGGYGDDGNNITLTGHNGTGFTERVVAGNSTAAQSYIEDKDSGASGAAQTAAMSTGTPNVGFWGMSCVVYKLAAGGGGGNTSTSAVTLPGPSTVVTLTESITGTSATTLAGVVSAATFSQTFTLTSATTLAGPSSAATIVIPGGGSTLTSATTLAGVVSAATLTESPLAITSTSAVTLAVSRFSATFTIPGVHLGQFPPCFATHAIGSTVCLGVHALGAVPLLTTHALTVPPNFTT